MIRSKKYYLLLPGLIILLLTSCSHDRNSRGYEYFNDMVVSTAYETDSENPFFQDGKTNQQPVAGTIARGHLPYEYGAKSADEQVRAGLELQNPIALNEETLTRGKEQFTIYCAVCHGDMAKGDGTIVANGKFAAIPADLNSDRVQSWPDGEIYHVITSGSISGLMGAHASQIQPDDRWMIVNYIKNKFSTKAK
ncbi:MAG: c-type cytochrome [Bacteroidales bacterium]|nr:c-type cytochrome [Bacteroidales bacterium]